MNGNEAKQRHFNILFMLTRRHLKMIFANRIRMMYTLMVPVIILVVYILFLRQLEISSIQANLPGLAANDNPQLLKHISTIVDSWMLSGLLSISTITVSLQINSLIVEDKEHGINRDFIASPVSRRVLIFSYFLYNFLVTALLSLVVFIICILFLAIQGEFVMGAADFFGSLGVMLFSCILSTLITTFICLFVNAEGVLASIIAAFSAAAGFLMGAYMPISMLPTGIRYACAVFPLTYACALSRFGFLATPFVNLGNYLAANPSIVPEGYTATQIMETIEGGFGYRIDFFGAAKIDVGYSALVVVVFLLLFLVLNILCSKRLAKIENKPLFRRAKK